MQLSVNGELVELPPEATVADVVADRAHDRRRVAVARNGDVVPRAEWGSTRLVDGDAVEVLTAVAGG